MFGLHFDNPVGIAAGFDKNAAVFEELAQLGFSHIEIGTVTPKAQPGNPNHAFQAAPGSGTNQPHGFNNNGLEAAINNSDSDPAK